MPTGVFYSRLKQFIRRHLGTEFSDSLLPLLGLANLPISLWQFLRWAVRNHILEPVQVVPGWPDDPYFPQYTAEINIPNGKVWANGIGETRGQALSKLVGEAAERYAQSVYCRNNFRRATYRELEDAADPFSFSGPSENQRKLPGWECWRISKESYFYWTKGVSLVTGKEKWLPAQLVFKPYQREPWEPIINLSATSGAAAELSRDKAVFHGIAELIEREAFLITYLNRLTPQKVNLRESGDALKRLFALFECCRLELNLYSLPTDSPLSVMLAVITAETPREPAIAVGAKADIDPITAAEGAILEANHTRVAIRRQLRNGATIPKDHTDVIYPRDHALFWAPFARIKNLDFLNGGAELRLLESREASDASADRSKLLEFFRTKKLDVFWVDLTLPVFKEFGIFAGKAISPSLHPLFIDERYPYYGSERLYRLPVELGYLARPLIESELNSVPHPFP